MLFCKVILLNNSQSFSNQVDNSLSYSVPAALETEIKLGRFCFVPVLDKVFTALVTEIFDQFNEEFKLKEVIELIDPQIEFSLELIDLIKFTATYYATPYSMVLSAIINSTQIPVAEKEIYLVDNPRQPQKELGEQSLDVLNKLKNCRSQKAKFNRLKALSKLPTKKLNQILVKLKNDALIEIKYHYDLKLKGSEKDYLKKFSQVEKSSTRLSANQETIFRNIINSNTKKHLIHGITGSGKTEVYFQLIEEYLNKGFSSIILVPEISLAPQLIDRLKKKFSDEVEIIIWHSALDEKEKLFSFIQLMNDTPKVVVGARSAIFSPVKNLGLIILDEEHENSYKQEQPAPRYHARLIAERRAELNQAKLILGSATPTIESYYKAKHHSDWELHKLGERFFEESSLATVELVDMKEEFSTGNKSIFSKRLRELITDRLNKKEMSILFLNKRGNSSHVFCRNCGYIYKCSHCDSKMVYHSDKHSLVCHLCNHTEKHPESCPACSSSSIKYFGLGTQKLEEETRKTFPEAKIVRLDSDTAKKKDFHLDTFKKFKNNEIDILIGTQMIAKGLDNARLTCVGVIAADNCFTQLDYQAEEKGFQLLTQVAGRAGRKDLAGTVIFQSYLNERSSLKLAQQQDYEKFYAEEIELRKEFIYPPFAKLIRFISSSENEINAIENLNKFHELIYSELEKTSALEMVQILGPSQCQINRINKQFRYHLLIKIPGGTITELQSLLFCRPSQKLLDLEEKIKAQFLSYKPLSKSRLVIDIDSISLQ